MTSRITEIENELDGLLSQEQSKTRELQWDRAVLYLEARRLHSSDTEFGEWKKRRSTAGGKAESVNTIHKLYLSAEYLTRDQFLRLGITCSAELMNVKAWKYCREQMEELANQNLTKMVFRDAVSVISEEAKAREAAEKEAEAAAKAAAKAEKAAAKTKTLPSPRKTVTKADLEVKVERLTIELAIERGTYEFSVEEFFHPDKEIFDMQLAKVLSGGKYANLFCGIDPFNLTGDMINSAERRLRLRWHPDRPSGVNEVMVVVNTVIGSYRAMLSSQEYARREAERFARAFPDGI